MKKSHPILYYTDHRIASLMHDWHGVKFETEDGKAIRVSNGFGVSEKTWDEMASVVLADGSLWDGTCWDYTTGIEKAYISKDSLYIFEPQEGDLVTITRSMGKPDPFAVPYIFRPVPDYDTLRRIIILRNNTAFFMPKIEGDVS